MDDGNRARESERTCLCADAAGHDSGLGSVIRQKIVETRTSIIVPVFNEASLIRPFLQPLRERAPEAEIIVADGGSSDGTDRLATGFFDQVVARDAGAGGR